MSADSQKYIPGFDGLRALAVAAVMACHLDFHRLSQGWIGVPLFFVLSGFLITGILLDAKGSPEYFRRFYSRRTVRILPIYYLLITTIFAIGIVRHWKVFDVSLFATFVDNWKLGVYGPTSGRVGFPPFMYHLWSLAVEEQFYLIWPVAIIALSRRAFVVVVGALIVSGILFRSL
ncbi:MAG TPA: acyltransferase, partial [Isosphaeraceae bacterium]|nr:acyltransferase [Isosphaeraceae bacterium]